MGVMLTLCRANPELFKSIRLGLQILQMLLLLIFSWVHLLLDLKGKLLTRMAEPVEFRDKTHLQPCLKHLLLLAYRFIQSLHRLQAC